MKRLNIGRCFTNHTGNANQRTDPVHTCNHNRKGITMTETTLVQKLAKIMSETKPFAKTGDNRGMNFKFVEVNEILLDVAPLFAKYEVVMFPTKIEPTKIEFGTTSRGGVSTHVFLNVTWEVTDGNTSLTVASFGEAIDTSDKASNKAQTAAEKQALQKLLLLANESDNDANNEQREYYRQPPAPPVNPELVEKKKQMRQIVEQLAEQFVRTKEQVLEVLIDDKAIPAAWNDISNITTVADAQKFIDAAVDYIQPEAE